MQLPLRITFHGMDPSPALETHIRERAERLDRFYDRIMGVHVTFEAPHRHRHKGRLYKVGIVLTVPGGEVIVNRSGPEDRAHEDANVAIRDAFDAAGRRLQDYARRQRGDIKAHEAPGHGRIARIFHDKGYGFIETADGREVYFHENSVVGDVFATLEVGGEVRLVEAEGESAEGPQASTVKPIGKHHLRD